MGWEGLRLGTHIPPSLNVKPGGLGPGMKGGNENACMFPSCQRRVTGRKVARSPGMANNEPYLLSPDWEVHSVGFPGRTGVVCGVRRAGQSNRGLEKPLEKPQR